MSEDIEYDYMLKLLLIGNTKTEKSTLLKSFTKYSSDDNFILIISVLCKYKNDINDNIF